MDPSDIQAGRELAGRYRLVSLLGQGGMGSVWKAEHLSLGSDVAVKLIDPAIAKNEQARERFVREARAAAKLRSPHVVQILDYGVDGEVPFIVMEMLRGESLADRLDRVGRLAPEETARIMSEVGRALTRAHEAGVVHRDLKPDNVFLNENDDTEVAKVLDFGVARIEQFSAENAGMTSTGAVLGTPYYMSPEQAEGSKTMDHRTDIWAMAVMTYECIVGARPFGGETLGALFVSICSRQIPVPSTLSDVPRGFDEWFAKGTARVVADRFPTARDAAQALREVCQVADVDRESALLGGRTRETEAYRAEGSLSMLGVDKEESAAIAGSTAGLGYTAMDIPGARRSSALPLALGGLAVLGVVVGVLALGGNDEGEQSEPEPIVVAAPVQDVQAEADVEGQDSKDLKPAAAVEPPEEKAPDEVAKAEPPVPEVAPVPAPMRAPAAAPRPVQPPAVKRTTTAAPEAAPAPSPAPAPRPAPPPKPKRVNLGI